MSSLTIFSGLTVANGAPDQTTDGIALGDIRFANELMATLVNTSQGAADAITARLWGRTFDNDEWFPLGTTADGSTNLTKGTMNGLSAIDVNGAPSNSANHAEMILSLRGLKEVYVQASTVTGTWDMFLSTRDPGNQGLGKGR